MIRMKLLYVMLWVAAVIPVRGWAVPILPLDEIRPGMRGQSLTVMKGTEILAIETEILGVRRDGMAPGKHMIIGRLIDKRTEVTGAVHGMSGSPLMIDGKLAGALSRRIALFEKDGHCGFTPIEDMLDVAARSSAPRARMLPGLAGPGWTGNEVVEGGWIGLPLAVEGLPQRVLDRVRGMLGPLSRFDLRAAPGLAGSPGSAAGRRFPLQPGSAVAAVLTDGDINLGATGTLTWRDGDRILGFGHPMLGLGTVSMPLASAEIITTVPSYQMPYKMSNLGEIEGTLEQDRLSAIYGRVGPLPAMGDYRIVRRHNGGARQELKGRFALDRNVTPSLLSLLALRGAYNAEDANAEMTLAVKGEVRFRDLPPLRIDAYASGAEEEVLAGVLEPLMPLGALYRDFAGSVEAVSMELNIETVEASAQWDVVQVTAGNGEWRKGRPARFAVRLRNQAGEETVREMELNLPEEMSPGKYNLRIVAGQVVAAREKSTGSAGLAERAADRIARLNQAVRPTTFQVEVWSAAEGVANGPHRQEMLPPSVLAVLRDSRRGGTVLREKIWTRSEIPVAGLARGSALTEVNLIP
jgi:hypothetical protein